MSAELSDEQNKLIKKIAEDEGIFDYSIDVKSGSVKGDNYLGIITAVTIRNQTDDRKIDLVLKSAHQSEIFRKQAPVRLFYLQEIIAYETIFPELNKFAEERGVAEAFTGHAKFYGSSSLEHNEILALENLREIGYDLWSRRVTMNPEHIALVFREYGKFHALSLAMKHTEPERYERLTSKFENNLKKHKPEENMLLVMFKAQTEKLLEMFKHNQKVIGALRKYKDNERWNVLVDKAQHQYRVITHGDCWNNNMMFQYDDPTNPSKPTKVCLLDWQIINVNSPVVDLSYFLYVCASKESLEDYQHFLKIYHESISEMLHKLGCGSDVFPYNALEEEWRKYSIFGMHMAVMVIKIMLADVDEAPNVEEIAERGKSLLEALDVETVHDGEYKRRLEELIGFMVERDFI